MHRYPSQEGIFEAGNFREVALAQVAAGEGV